MKRDFTLCKIAKCIGDFYHKQSGCSEASALLTRLRIHKLEMDNAGTLHITTERPGLLIGRRGENIVALLEHLKTNAGVLGVSIVKINLIEEYTLSYLFAFERRDLDTDENEDADSSCDLGLTQEDFTAYEEA